ncbi:MAG: hypothetical protein RBQ99_10675 [Trichlorobacter sp.]|nr:hypothetical protein [Trichlorobacter sp.]
MKKLLLSISALTLALSFSSAGTSHAAEIKAANFTEQAGKTITGYDTAGAAGNATPIGQLSSNVALAAKSDTGGYVIITTHRNGTKAFGTGSDSTTLYSATIDKTKIGNPEIKEPTAARAADNFFTETTDDDGNVIKREEKDAAVTGDLTGVWKAM